MASCTKYPDDPSWPDSLPPSLGSMLFSNGKTCGAVVVKQHLPFHSVILLGGSRCFRPSTSQTQRTPEPLPYRQPSNWSRMRDWQLVQRRKNSSASSYGPRLASLKRCPRVMT